MITINKIEEIKNLDAELDAKVKAIDEETRKIIEENNQKIAELHVEYQEKRNAILNSLDNDAEIYE
jgi:FtsZ-binding cell division protein ZapB